MWQRRDTCIELLWEILKERCQNGTPMRRWENKMEVKLI